MTATPKKYLPTLLVADDDENLCQQLRWALNEDFKVMTAHSPDAILSRFTKRKPDLVLLDLNYTETVTDGREGLDLIEKILGHYNDVKIIVMTGNQEREVARMALSAGAHDHLLKPIDINELNVVLRRATFALSLAKEKKPKHAANKERADFYGIIGQSPEMQNVFAIAKNISPTDATVLISGESGSGKELIARVIHYLSPRQQNNFVAINCGAIPENLLESELFGHEKGAFTGAVSQRKGKFEYANNGTIFLDEIGELPHVLQVKLLRFLQDRIINRVGGNTSIELNVRIVAATNSELEKEIARGAFREDIYYRFNVLNIKMPPLRERSEDIIALAVFFLEKFSTEYKKNLKNISPKALQAIRKYNWPGNVRELENRMRKAVILARHSVILPEDLELNSKTITTNSSLRASIGHLEKDMLIKSLRKHQGIVTEVAKDLDVNRTTLYDLFKKHDVDPNEFKMGMAR
ncbi:MAG: sigma-54-dependent transcriptional regulator [bacterium]